MELKFKKLDKNAMMPTKGTEDSAAVDFYSMETIDIESGGFRKVGTGLAVEIPHGHFGLVAPRSGKATKEGLILRSSNFIDEDFRGMIMICCYNLSDRTMHIEKGERIAQMAIIPVPEIKIVEVLELSNTKRGSGGFGSTDKK